MNNLAHTSAVVYTNKRRINSPVNWGNWLGILETVTVCKYIFITCFDLQCVGRWRERLFRVSQRWILVSCPLTLKLRI